MSDNGTNAAPPPSIPEGFVEVGDVPAEVMNAVNTMRARHNQIVMEIGQMEARKVNLVSELNRLESQTQSMLKAEAGRMGIPEGHPWQLTPQGKALAPPIGG